MLNLDMQVKLLQSRTSFGIWGRTNHNPAPNVALIATCCNTDAPVAFSHGRAESNSVFEATLTYNPLTGMTPSLWHAPHHAQSTKPITGLKMRMQVGGTEPQNAASLANDPGVTPVSLALTGRSGLAQPNSSSAGVRTPPSSSTWFAAHAY